MSDTARQEAVPIQIAVTHFYGSPEYCVAHQNGTLIQCAVFGCHEQVLFKDEDNWVCFAHGQLSLRRNWDRWDTPLFLTASLEKPVKKVLYDEISNEISSSHLTATG